MSKIRIVGLRKHLEQVTALLHEAGLVHIVKPDSASIPHLKQLAPGEDLAQEINRLEQNLSRIRSIVFSLSLEILKPMENQVSPDQVTLVVERLVPLAGEYLARKEKLQQEFLLLDKYETVLIALAPLITHLGESPYLEYLGLTLTGTKESLHQRLDEILSGITGGKHEMVVRPAGPDSFVALLVYPKNSGAEIRKVLWEAGLADIRLPAAYSDRSFVEALKGILERKTHIPQEIEEIDRQIRSLSEKYGLLLVTVRDRFENRLTELKASISFYGTSHTFLIYGWIPRSEVPSIRKHLSDLLHVWVEELPFPPHEWDQVPVLLKNFRFLKVFERLTSLLPSPQYGGTDPTPWFAFFFPIFFGMMVGDAGYGALFLGFAWWIRRRWRRRPLIRDLSTIFAVSSGIAMAFGFFFGEYFGFSAEHLSLPGGWIHRVDSLIVLMELSIGVGFVQLALGLMLRLFSSRRRRERKELWVATAKLLFLSGSALILLHLLDTRPIPWAFWGWAAISLAFMIFVLQEKWRAPLAAMKMLTQTLSYVRLMGFGAAAVFLAYIANFLGREMSPWFLGLAAALFFHGLNILIGLYAPTVQALRLLYVEFCDQFYLSGGIPYQPFSKKMKEVTSWR
ncbi:MAG: hypothetical protein HZA19_06105 [Nitrospirae bacterium]|nr:hypothetical protein [Nitrospirota bacterium]